MKNKEINKTIIYLDSWDGDIHCPRCGHCLIPQAQDGEDEVWTCLHCNIEVDKTVVQLTFLDKLDLFTKNWFVRIPIAMAFFYLAIVAITQGLNPNNYIEMILFTIFGLDVLLLWR